MRKSYRVELGPLTLARNARIIAMWTPKYRRIEGRFLELLLSKYLGEVLKLVSRSVSFLRKGCEGVPVLWMLWALWFPEKWAERYQWMNLHNVFQQQQLHRTQIELINRASKQSRSSTIFDYPRVFLGHKFPSITEARSKPPRFRGSNTCSQSRRAHVRACLLEMAEGWRQHCKMTKKYTFLNGNNIFRFLTKRPFHL